MALNRVRILLVGSSIIELWHSADKMLSPYPVLNLGVSGTTTSDWLGSRGLLHTKLFPLLLHSSLNITHPPSNDLKDVIVFYCGSNDINVGIKEERIRDRTVAILKAIWQRSPSSSIMYLSVMQAPQKIRDGLSAKVKRLNEVIQEEIAMRSLSQGQAGTALYVEVNDVLSGYSEEEESLVPESLVPIYEEDQLHLTTKGYELLAQQVLQGLERLQELERA